MGCSFTDCLCVFCHGDGNWKAVVPKAGSVTCAGWDFTNKLCDVGVLLIDWQLDIQSSMLCVLVVSIEVELLCHSNDIAKGW